eukprot:6322639-Pyramimonas_sp.AAC.1
MALVRLNNRLYSLPPSAIGARYGYILSPLPRLVPAKVIFSLSFRDWGLVSPGFGTASERRPLRGLP